MKINTDSVKMYSTKNDAENDCKYLNENDNDGWKYQVSSFGPDLKYFALKIFDENNEFVSYMG
jgi:hypothetical protein